MADNFPVCETQPSLPDAIVQYIDPPELQVCEDGTPLTDTGQWSEMETQYFSKVATQPGEVGSSWRRYLNSYTGFIWLVDDANAADTVRVCTPGEILRWL